MNNNNFDTPKQVYKLLLRYSGTNELGTITRL